MNSKYLMSRLKTSTKKYFFKLGDMRYYIMSYSPKEVSKADWESQYCSKYWDYLKDISELARYSVISGYCNYFKINGNILDVGCGEGVLHSGTATIIIPVFKIFGYRYFR